MDMQQFRSHKNSVMENMGISIISKMSVMEEIKEGRLHTVLVEGMSFKREFNIIYHKNKYVTEAMKEFWEGMRKE